MPRSRTQLVLIAFDPWLWVACLAGVTLGILWGAMPGLSTTMAMTLLIGLTVGMSQYTAIMFMLGVYTGSVFGGAISAVLVNIPGTPDAVPTMIEGYKLARRGEGGLALGTAISASFVGNWVGIVLLIALIPAILFLALQFRSWEMFLLSLWGIAICGSMSSMEAPIKGGSRAGSGCWCPSWASTRFMGCPGSRSAPSTWTTVSASFPCSSACSVWRKSFVYCLRRIRPGSRRKWVPYCRR